VALPAGRKTPFGLLLARKHTTASVELSYDRIQIFSFVARADHLIWQVENALKEGGGEVQQREHLPAQLGIEKDWIARAKSLKPMLEAAAPRIEASKSLPEDVLDALHQLQMFRMLMPRSVGGAELDPATYAQVVAAIAEGDASVAWCIAQSSPCSMSAAYMDPSIANELFGDPKAVFTWGFAAGRPPCRAVRVKGGWVVNGVWTFASGSRLSSWLGGHVQIHDENGSPSLDADGRVVERTMLFPRSSVLVRDDRWDVMGLLGTGSDTYEAADLFVPELYSVVQRGIGRDQQLPEGVRRDPDTDRREEGILYKHSNQALFQAGLSSVAIGLARATLDAFIQLAKVKSPAIANQSLRDDSWIHARIAQADAKVSAAHAWLLSLLREAWNECAVTGEISFPTRVRIRTACTHQISEARDAVYMIYLEAGATAIFKSNPFERRFRDMHTLSQQPQGSIARMQSVGQYYVGIKPSLFLLP
jgi:alkylation response protein AidB-like acyl-CoA dehydrogenase